jgi:hypothetical protein
LTERDRRGGPGGRREHGDLLPENGEHVQTPAVYPQEFERRLAGFFREALGE